MNTTEIPEKIITHDGDTWKVLSTGTIRDGKIYVHLLSTTRFPVQICDWVPVELIEEGK